MSKVITMQPREVDVEKMINDLEPFIDNIPGFFRELFQSYRDNTYDGTTRKDERKHVQRSKELRGKQNVKQREQFEEDICRLKEQVYRLKKSEKILQQEKDRYEDLLKQKEKEHDDALKSKGNYREDIEQMKQDYERQFSELKDNCKKQLQNKDDEVIRDKKRLLKRAENVLQEVKGDNEEFGASEEFQTSTTDKPDYQQVLENTLEQLRQNVANKDATLERKKHELEKREADLNVYVNEKEEEIRHLEESLRQKDNEKNELVAQMEARIESKWESLLNEKKHESEKREADLSAYVNEKEIEIQHLEERKKEWKKQEADLQLHLNEKEKKIRSLEESLTQKHYEIQELLAQKEEEYNDKWKKILNETTTRFANEKLQLQQQLQCMDTQVKNLMGKTKLESDNLKRSFNEEMERKNKELEKIKKRYAAASERKFQSDQRKVENTLSCNRRSVIEQQFNSFFDEDRLDACEIVKSYYRQTSDDQDIILIPRLICMAFEIAYEQMIAIRDGYYKFSQASIAEIVSNAALFGKHWADCKKYYNTKASFSIFLNHDTDQNFAQEINAVVEGMLLLLKERADQCSLEPFVKDLKEEVRQKWYKSSTDPCNCLPTYTYTSAIHIIDNLGQYIQKSALLAWHMATQMPPLQLEFRRAKYTEKIHEVIGYHPKMESRGRAPLEIACYLWPILHEESKVIQKGKVITKTPSS